MLNRQELADKFLFSIIAKPNNTKKLFAIGFIGTTAVGKTTTSEMLARKLNLYIARNDEIRRFLNAEGFPGKFPDQDLVNFIGSAVTNYLYKIKSSHIIDADMIRFHVIGRKNALDGGADLLLIHLVCPEHVILERIKMRQSAINKSKDYSDVGFSLSVKKEYEERNKMHEELPIPKNIYFKIDTSNNFEQQLQELISKLKLDNYL